MSLQKADRNGSALSSREIEVLITIERAGAGLSMGAIALTVFSFVLLRKLRTTPNLFLVFASIANAGASIASMMGYDGLHKGENSSLCQVQGFIFEWFMQSDPWWSFAMAINVFLVFFCNADPTIFRKYVWVYCVVCFGGPMIPAVVLISIRDDPRGPIFGDAALWCWIGNNWSLVRLYAYYIPIWICIILTILIYIAVGFHVFRQRNQLRIAALHATEGSGRTCSAAGSHGRNSTDEGLAGRHDTYATAVTEVQITSYPHSMIAYKMPATMPPAHVVSRATSPWAAMRDEYHHNACVDHTRHRFETTCTSDYQPVPSVTVFNKLRGVTSSASLKLKQLDPIKMAYLRTSFIFGFAILITWIPSSINRIYSLMHDGRVSFQLSIASGCVLPLQGVWNAIIFFITSGRIVREEVRMLRTKAKQRKSKAFSDGECLDSRLDIVGYESRNAARQTPAINGKEFNSNPCQVDEVEMHDGVASVKSCA